MFKLISILVLLSIFCIACSNNSDSTFSDKSPENSSDNSSDNNPDSNDNNSTDNGSNSDNSSNGDDSNNETDTPEDNKPVGGADSDDDTFIYTPPADCSYHKNSKPTTSILAGTNKGIYYSTDNGVTWEKSTMPIGLDSSWGAFADIGNNTVLSASGGNKDDNNKLGILKSIDGGVSWQRTGMKHGQWNDLLHVADNIILASSSSVEIGGVWRSTDYGETWIKNKRDNITDPFDATTVDLADGISDGIVTALGKIDNCTIIVGKKYRKDNILQISEDGGKKWYKVAMSPRADVISQFLLHSSGYLFATLDNENGIVKSDYPQVSWETAFPPQSYHFGPIIELRDSTIVAGVKDIIQSDISQVKHGGLWLSFDGGESYSKSSMNKFFWLSLLALDDGSAIGGCTSVDDRATEYQCSGLYKSTDNDNSWSKADTSMNNLIIYKLIAIRR